MHIEPFGVEIWMNAHETRCRLNLAETCVAAMTLDDLRDLTGGGDLLAGLEGVALSYGAIEGSERLRRAVAALHPGRDAADVLIAHGTIGANDLAWRALAGPGDHVVSLVPTYQQHVSIPESLGAEVTRIALRPEDGWLPDLDALGAALRPGRTRVLAFTNPNNPTGSLMPEPMLRAILEMAESAGVTVLADEVYRGTAQAGDGRSPSVATLSPRAVATGGMSKAFSLAGLRLGWIVGPGAVREAAMQHRDYTTISVGVVDDHLAARALEQAGRILARSRAITRQNLALVDDWIAGEPALSWVRPAAGTTALLAYDRTVGSERFCLDLLARTGVLLTPGAAMGMEGTLRLGFGNRTEDLRAGLPLISRFLAEAVAA